MGISPIGSSDEELFKLDQAPIKTLEHPACGQLRLLSRMESVNSRYVENFELETQKNLDKSASLDQEKREALRKEEEWVQTRKVWNVAVIGTEYLTSTTTLTLGWAIRNALWGKLLIASAVLGLANRILQDTGVMHAIISRVAPEESQTTWAFYSEVIPCIAAVGMGLAGGIGAYRSGALANTWSKETIGKVFAIAVGISGVIAQIGKSYADWHLAHLQADMKDSDTGMIQIDQEINTSLQHIQRMMGTTREIGDNVRQTIAQMA